MTQPTITAGSKPADPLKSVGDAMALGLQAARDGASDAEARISEMMPVIGGFLNRLTYTTCYAVSYGVVFPTLLVARSVPRDNVLVQGLVAGAQAAQDAVSAYLQENVTTDITGSDTHHGLIIPGRDDVVRNPPVAAESTGSEPHHGLIIPGGDPTS